MASYQVQEESLGYVLETKKQKQKEIWDEFHLAVPFGIVTGDKKKDEKPYCLLDSPQIFLVSGK